ncbi:Vitamin K epoxide reductase family protein [Poriferisphaera corsica]|uniref:Vitamin K epoxide reductase family protein n=1 Tax=Poriferisphaera corsica TaxID=2528020 RepID=A0A517YWR3_9BACT|nr:vitamin K epoxide reductase family protein [Poriferisphaera corsica]QDU34683.1 Vitamin K epoxide reductase family protein [Poriferisphaera corsica]
MNDTLPDQPIPPSNNDLVTLMRIPSKTTTVLLRIYATLGFLLTLYLTYNALSSTPLAGCAPGSACDTVLSSPYAKIGNLPVALPAAVLYFLTLFTSFYLSPKNPPTVHRTLWYILLVFAYVFLASALYFTAIQIFIIQAFCKYCLASHIIALLTAVTIFARNQSLRAIRSGMHLTDPRPTKFQAKSHFAILIIAAILFAPLPLIQKIAPVQTHAVTQSVLYVQGTGQNRTVSYQVSPVATITFPIAILPHIGDIDAPVILTELVDYTCPNCRDMAPDLKALTEQFPDRYLLNILPVPLNSKCNRLVTNTQSHAEAACDLANIAMAFWLSYPQYFPQIHNDLMTGKTPPTAEQACQYALKYITQEQLDQALSNPLIEAQIKAYVEVYAAVGGSLPALFTGSAIIQGYPGQDQFIPLLLNETQNQVHLPPPNTGPATPMTPLTPPAKPAPTTNEQPDSQTRAMSPDDFYNYSSQYTQVTGPTPPITGCDTCPRETIMNQQKNAPVQNN